MLTGVQRRRVTYTFSGSRDIPALNNIAKKIAIFEILTKFDAIFRDEGLKVAKKTEDM